MNLKNPFSSPSEKSVTENSQTLVSRRSFQSSFLILPIAVFFSKLAFAEKKRGGAVPAAGAAAGATGDCALPLAKPTDNPGIKLQIDRSKVPAELKKVSSGVAWDKQHCESCQIFIPSAGKCDGQTRGKCPLLNGKTVSADWWCTSWAKKT